MKKQTFVFSVAFFPNLLIVVFCAVNQFGYHLWSPVVHAIVVGCLAALNVVCLWVMWNEDDRSPQVVYHWRQLCLLSIHLFATGGFVNLFEEYAKFPAHWSPAKVRTAPAHELAVEVAWRLANLAYLFAYAITTPDVKATTDYIKSTPKTIGIN